MAEQRAIEQINWVGRRGAGQQVRLSSHPELGPYRWPCSVFRKVLNLSLSSCLTKLGRINNVHQAVFQVVFLTEKGTGFYVQKPCVGSVELLNLSEAHL